MEDWQRKYFLNKAQGNPILNIPSQQNTGNGGASDAFFIPPKKESQTCSIRPGAILYRSIDANGFGATAVFVVPNGQAPQDFSTKQFDYKAEASSCYLMENQMQLIDMGRLNEKQALRLVRVSAPFVGSFFVQECNIIPNTQYNKSHGNKTVLRG